MARHPLDPISLDALVAALPKADLHLHQEAPARLERMAALRQGRSPYDWQRWARRVFDEVPAGFGRLGDLLGPDASLGVAETLFADPRAFVAMVAAILEEGAANGAVLVEVRFGPSGRGIARPDFMALFRATERQAQTRYSRLRAEAIGYLNVRDDPEWLSKAESQLEACLRAAREGLGGVDFRIDPYATEADPALWAIASRWAERAADAGLGITVHAGEFSADNLAAALRVPGLRRLGHAAYAASEPRLLERLAACGVTVECCLTCNVMLGAVSSYDAHPIRQLVDAGIAVTLNTDLPVHLGTTIGREYAVAAALGFSPAELLGFTRNAVRASFAPAERRDALLAEMRKREADLLTPRDPNVVANP